MCLFKNVNTTHPLFEQNSLKMSNEVVWGGLVVWGGWGQVNVHSDTAVHAVPLVMLNSRDLFRDVCGLGILSLRPISLQDVLVQLVRLVITAKL